MTKTNAQIGKALMDCFTNLPEVDEAIDAIEAALLDQADRLEQDEPYATKSIRSLRDAAGRVRDLIDAVHDANEDDTPRIKLEGKIGGFQ